MAGMPIHPPEVSPSRTWYLLIGIDNADDDMQGSTAPDSAAYSRNLVPDRIPLGPSSTRHAKAHPVGSTALRSENRSVASAHIE